MPIAQFPWLSNLSLDRQSGIFPADPCRAWPRPYELDDPLFYDGLLNRNEGHGGWREFHIPASEQLHPSTMNEQAQRVQAGNSSYLLRPRAVSILYEYLDQLKAVRHTPLDHHHHR